MSEIAITGFTIFLLTFLGLWLLENNPPENISEFIISIIKRIVSVFIFLTLTVMVASNYTIIVENAGTVSVVSVGLPTTLDQPLGIIYSIMILYSLSTIIVLFRELPRLRV